jgi:hypothetical protein
MVRGCVSLAAEKNALLLLELAIEEMEVFWRRRVFKQSAEDDFVRLEGKKETFVMII